MPYKVLRGPGKPKLLFFPCYSGCTAVFIAVAKHNTPYSLAWLSLQTMSDSDLAMATAGALKPVSWHWGQMEAGQNGMGRGKGAA